jgi:hypothetical protein
MASEYDIRSWIRLRIKWLGPLAILLLIISQLEWRCGPEVTKQEEEYRARQLALQKGEQSKASSRKEPDQNQTQEKSTRDSSATTTVNDQSPFPCNSCLLLTIRKVGDHTEYMYHGDKAKVDVVAVIEDVIKPGIAIGSKNSDPVFRNGGTVVFVFDDPKMLSSSRIEQLVGVRTVWGVDWWRIEPGRFHVDKLFEPFPDHAFTINDIEGLKQRLRKAT